MGKRGPAPRPAIERFTPLYEVADDGCWMWIGGTNGKYATFAADARRAYSRTVYAHRWSYEYHREPIPEGLVINHLCEQPLCVNPDHLEVVTHRENLMYSDTPTRRRAEQTHCVNGHPFNEANTRYKPNGTRRCRLCANEKMRQRRAGLPDAEPCAIAGCDGKAMTRGWCAFHYGRWWHYGDPLREPS